MRAIDVVRVLLGAVLALALLPAVAGAGLLGDAGPPDGVQRQAGADLRIPCAPILGCPTRWKTSWLASDKKLQLSGLRIDCATGDAATTAGPPEWSGRRPIGDQRAVGPLVQDARVAQGCEQGDLVATPPE